MHRITATLDKEQGLNPLQRFIKCPECRQKLFEIGDLKGFSEVRIKCRRCGKFVNVEMVGID